MSKGRAMNLKQYLKLLTLFISISFLFLVSTRFTLAGTVCTDTLGGYCTTLASCIDPDIPDGQIDCSAGQICCQTAAPH